MQKIILFYKFTQKWSNNQKYSKANIFSKMKEMRESKNTSDFSMKMETKENTTKMPN